jgi:hypothetical protein
MDPNRFWDWQKSPIEFTPPDITGVSAASRALPPQGLTPTAFPQSVLNIVNPGALPDPTGLANALKDLGTPGIFRDQSGLQETGTMLGKLSDNATTLASQALQGQNRKGLMDDINASNLSPAQKTELIGKLLAGQVEQQTKPAGSTTGQGSGAGQGSTKSGGTAPSETSTGTTTTASGNPQPVSPKPPVTNGGTPGPAPVEPKTNKPTRSQPVSPEGLTFNIQFQNAERTIINGSAKVHIKGKGIEEEHFEVKEIELNGISVFAPTVSSAGKIGIMAYYQLSSYEDALAAGLGNANTGIPAAPQFLILDGASDYPMPAKGNAVYLTAVPSIDPKKITASSAKAATEQVSATLGANMGIASVSASGSAGSTTTTGTTTEWVVKVVGPGLIVTPAPSL